jgi:ABC-type multidrug transport system ATPase subunit
MKVLKIFEGGVADTLVSQYSGGMKRRLSVAISLIGDPKVLIALLCAVIHMTIREKHRQYFLWRQILYIHWLIYLFGSFLQVVYLDEPSTGLDPASRSALWDAVKLAKKDKAIILTSNIRLISLRH